MKKIINNSLLIGACIGALTIYSCGNKKEENSKTPSTDAIIMNVDTVVAIGKVTAENGTALIATNTSGMIASILIKEGDTVKKGDLLIKLKNQTAELDLDLANVKLKSIQEQNYTTLKDIDREQINLNYLEKKFETTKNLYLKQAETKENYLNDESNYLQQKQRVASLKNQLKINQNQIKEQELSINKTKISNEEYSITAPESGLITTLSAKIGQNININESIGEIINIDNLIIEAEVDELFADRIKVGQQVSIININTKQNLGTGQIIYSSPTLMNKSILYETANEADDRRVLRIKIKPSNVKNLLINAKVECQIKIK